MRLLNWIADRVGQILAEGRRFADDTRGNIIMMVGLTMPALILMTMGGVDIHRLSTARMNLQDALDAATLAAARSPYVTDAQLKEVGWATLQANLAAYPGITARIEDATFTVNDDDVVIANANIRVRSIAAHIFLPPYGKFLDEYVPVSSHSEVDRASRNIEVALVLDTTGSMAGQKIIDLRAAANDLVDIVVQDLQTPFYSKVAIVPYSMAVNVDTYATSARGTIKTSVPITNAVINLAGTPKTITAASRTRPVRITSAAHGFVDNDIVWISGAQGMTSLNNKPYYVDRIDADHFDLYNMSGNRVNGENYNSYTGTAGRVQKCQNNDCSITITAASHGLINNDYVYITGVGGMTQINDKPHLVGNVTANTYTIDLVEASLSPYTSGGQSWCAQEGCTWFAFENVYDNIVAQRISTCVTDRSGTNAYTDVAPSSARLGRNYPSTSNGCLANKFRPLSSDKAQVKTNISALGAAGSTGGHVGVAWGWYALSPNFSALFGSSAGSVYNTADTLKAVVIMTDGEYNSGYCKGVISADSTSGSGDRATHISCNSPNGHPFDQSLALCREMKRTGVIVYTVGFQVVDDQRARDLVNNCATSANHVYLANSGATLGEAFRAIGRDITKLRISK